MVDADGILAFFGTYMVTTLPAVLPYLEEQRIPMIGSSNGSEAADHSPMVYNPQVGSDLGTTWSYLLALTTQSDKRKVAVLYCSEASTCPNQYDGLKRIAPEAGVDIVYAGQMSIAQPDYTAQMLAARNAGAEVVMCICDPPSQIRMIRSAHRQDPGLGGHPERTRDQLVIASLGRASLTLLSPGRRRGDGDACLCRLR